MDDKWASGVGKTKGELERDKGNGEGVLVLATSKYMFCTFVGFRLGNRVT